jgi:hypothetical protein
MNEHYIKSSPRFFRLIKASGTAVVATLLAAALFVPAPLQEPGDLGRVPNPVKSAWFLLWIQELVSYRTQLIYLVLLGALLFLLLPWLPGSARRDRASWHPAEQLPVVAATLLVSAVIILLTVIAMFFRGENWALVFP